MAWSSVAYETKQAKRDRETHKNLAPGANERSVNHSKVAMPTWTIEYSLLFLAFVKIVMIRDETGCQNDDEQFVAVHSQGST